jgi:hypothetical protein
VWTGFESRTGSMSKRNAWFFHHLAKCTDMLLYLCSDFDFGIKCCLSMIQLNGKIQTNFARVIYNLNGCFCLSHLQVEFYTACCSVSWSVCEIMLIIEWKVYTFKVHVFPGRNTNFSGPLNLVWNCNKLV